MNERMGAYPWVARTQFDHARMLLSRGKPRDRDRSRELIHEALATAEKLGMKSLAAKASALREEADTKAQKRRRPRSRPST